MKTRLSCIEPLEARIAPAAAVFELSSLDGLNGFKVSGVAVNDFSGSAVSDAGDINGDGFGDLIIGALAADPYSVSSGASYVVFGKASGFAAGLNLSALDGSNGFKISGVAAGDESGRSVSGAGDVNGDGFGDLIVGAKSADPNGSDSGASYVIFGKSSGFTPTLNLSSLNGSNGFRLNGVAPGDYSGVSVSGAGDVNGDGFGDLIIGAHRADPNGVSSGASYVVFGKASGFAASVNLSTLDGTNGFKLSGVAAGGSSGISVSAAGDVNGDGLGDVIIGAHDAGAGYVVFGKASGFAANLNLSTLDGSNGFKMTRGETNTSFGFSVSDAGDVNGDGFDDVIVGAFSDNANGTDSGASYVIFGKAGGFAADLNVSALDGGNGFKLSGVAAYDFSGVSVSKAGDFDGDGFDDLIIGANLADPNGASSGASYLVYGKATGFLANLDLSTLDGSNGFKLNGAAADDYAGRAVSSGDLNGDGFADLIIGAMGADANGIRNSGASYVVFGSAAATLPSISISDATTLEGNAGTGALSFAVSLSAASTQTVTVQVSTVDGTATAGSDYTAVINQTVQFAPGETTKIIPVTVIGDTEFEPNESFFVNLSSPTNATFADVQGLGTILDDDAPPTIRINDVRVAEGTSGTTARSFTVSLSKPSSLPVTVQYATANGSATAPEDYTALPPATLTFDPGEQSKTVTVTINGDTAIEPDETLFVNLSNPTNATLLDAEGVLVILDDDSVIPSLVELSELNGDNGFRLSGESVVDYAGFSVSDAGDINGDGFGDVIVGAFNRPDGDRSGASYVVFGKVTGFAPNLDLATLDGTSGFKLSGAFGEQSGVSVSAAGDVNGDGFGDLIIGASSADASGENFGASYVVFGKGSAFPANMSLAALNGSNGFKLSGAAAYDRSGASVSAAGDVNGDGFGDVIIGAFHADPSGEDSGAAYLVFGKASGFAANLNLSTLDGANGFKLSGVAKYDYSGLSVAGAGDINGDGFDDVIIGALHADPNGSRSGASYVVFGKASGFAADFQLSAVDGSNGFKLSGVAANDQSGRSVSGAGDVNGDGFDDLIVGAREATGPNGPYSGASYVVFGKASGFAANLNLSTLDGSNGFTVNGAGAIDLSGHSVSRAGDVNGDGFDDLVIGAYADARYAGATYVVFGKAGGFAPNLDLSSLDGSNGFTMKGAADADGSGWSVSTAGDVNGDGFDDVIIGAFRADPNGDRSGASYVVFGNRSGGATPAITIGDAATGEGDAGTQALTFPVTLSFAHTETVTVQFSTVDGTATAGSDYTGLINQTVEFAPGETSKMIVVTVNGDTTPETAETLSVVLSTPTNATLAERTARGTIFNDDLPSLSIDDVSVAEGNSGTVLASFTISLSEPAAEVVTVQYGSESEDGTAIAPLDYDGLFPGTLTFNPGELSKTVTVSVNGDTASEPHETFLVLLSGATNAFIADDTGTGTILNDDALLRISDASVLEGHTGTRAMTFTVSLSHESVLPVSVSFTAADGSATAGADYTAVTPGTLTFAPGETSKTVTVDVLGDVVVDANESFSVLLSEATNAVIDDPVGVGRILDDDVTLIGKRKARFTDVDGDVVTIEVSKGRLKVEDFTLVPSGLGSQLALVDFSGDTRFAGADLRITAKPAAGTPDGVRFVDVGAINASGIDLGNVLIKGDLGQIDAGNALDPGPGLLSLNVKSLGVRGLDTQLPGGSLQSDITGTLKTLLIKGDVQDAALSVSGNIGAITIRSDVLGGEIHSDRRIGAVNIGGDLATSATGDATISARGKLAPSTNGKALAIASLSIGGSVDHAQILAGYDRTGAAVNADVRIGAVLVGQDWVASSLAAGVSRGPDGMFGTDDDVLIAGGNPIIAKIASIVITGIATGTEGGTDHFGFVAEQIGAFRSGGTALALTRGPGNDLAGVLVGSTGDLRVREVA